MQRTQIWSCGGGVQSAAVAVLIVQGVYKPDLCVIADTGAEQSTTWQYMDAVLRPALATVGLELHRVRSQDWATVGLYGGKDGETLLVPVFTNQSGEVGKLPSYCSNEWKQRVVRRWATAQGVEQATMWLGISTDEMQRLTKGTKKWNHLYPLVDQRLNRQECELLVERMGWPKPPRSSCWMCPNHTQEEWRDIRDNKPKDWTAAIRFDRAIRRRDPNAFLHPDCVPLDKANLDDSNGVLFSHGCSSGHCFV
nr:hypothetical protein [uncultured Rhodoferax sp.]